MDERGRNQIKVPIERPWNSFYSTTGNNKEQRKEVGKKRGNRNREVSTRERIQKERQNSKYYSDGYGREKERDRERDRRSSTHSDAITSFLLHTLVAWWRHRSKQAREYTRRRECRHRNNNNNKSLLVSFMQRKTLEWLKILWKGEIVERREWTEREGER